MIGLLLLAGAGIVLASASKPKTVSLGLRPGIAGLSGSRPGVSDVDRARGIYATGSAAAEDVASCVTSGTNCGDAWQGVKDTARAIGDFYNSQCAGGSVLAALAGQTGQVPLCTRCPEGTTARRLTLPEAVRAGANYNRNWWCVGPDGSKALK